MKWANLLVICALLLSVPCASAQTDTASVQGWVNARDFGAQGNGQNDDSAAFALAIESQRKLGGGDVIAPRGTYAVKNVSLPTGVRIKGVGVGATKFVLPAGAASTDVCFVPTDNASVANQIEGAVIDSSVVTPESVARRRDLLLRSPPANLDTTIYHWRHYLGSGATYNNRDDFYVPFGTNLYAQYSFNQYTGTSVRTFGATNECRAGLFTAAASSTRAGTWSTATEGSVFVPGTPDAGGGTYYSSTDAAATMTFSGASMTGNALALIIVGFTNNGYAIVEVDGDQTGSATGANLLPKVTAAMTVSQGGLFLDSDVGKTYIDFYAGAFIGDEHVGIAENLDEDAEHSLKIYVRNTKGTAASSGTSVRVVGAVACRKDSIPTTANHRMVRFRKINDQHLSLSACTIVVGWDSTTSTSTYRLVGENHVGTDNGIAVAEAAVSHAITDAAGDTVTPTAGTYASSKEFVIKRVTTLAKGGTTFSQKTVTYRLRADTPMQLTATGRLNFIVDGYVHTALIGMLPCFQMRDRYSATPEKTDFNRALLGDRVIPNIEWLSGSSIEYKSKNVDTIAHFSTTHDTVCLMHCPRTDLTLNNGLYASPDESYVRAVANTVNGVAPGGLKSYFGRVGQSPLGGTPEPAPAGTVYEFDVGWRVMRVKRAADVLQLKP